MLSTPAPASSANVMFNAPVQPAVGGGGGLNDLFSIQGALPGAGYVAPPTVCFLNFASYK